MDMFAYSTMLYFFLLYRQKKKKEGMRMFQPHMNTSNYNKESNLLLKNYVAK